MTERYMIVQIKNYFLEVALKKQHTTSCFKVVEMGFDFPHVAALKIKESEFENPDWYIVMPYYE